MSVGDRGTEFIQWLISQANEGKWSKEDVGSILCKKNRDNQLLLATLDEETKKQAAVFNKAKTISAAPYMDTDFLQWLYQEAAEGRWDQSMVFEAVVKEDSDGKISFSPKIKPGMSIVNFLYSITSTHCKNLFHQPLNSQALDLLEIIMVPLWEDLSLSLGWKEIVPLCTSKLTQEKCQRMMKSCCSGGKNLNHYSFIPLI